MHLFLDLDGTLLDSKQRLYKLFAFLVRESAMSFEEYWDLKKNAISHAEILKNKFNYSDTSISTFQQDWHKLIEDPDWIIYDKPYNGITDKLFELKKKYSLILVTSRQFVNIVNWQIEKFKWEKAFQTILVTEQKVEKENLILEKVDVGKNDWIIGDTGKDVQAGKFLNIKTAAVLSGFRNKENLNKYLPDIILNDLLEFNI